jgi:phosphoribosylamine-glycine ligase
MVVTATGSSIEQARADAYARVERVAIPDARYRLDIGDRLVASQYAAVGALGLLG